jgi:hypothetical protein
MAEVPSYTKVAALGHRASAALYEDGNIEVTEKLDGSQFAFGVVGGDLSYRSKGRQIPRHSIQDNDLFYPVTQWVESAAEAGLIPEDAWFYGETLCKPKHSTLRYDRVPRNHFALFAARPAMDETDWFPYEGLRVIAESMGCDIANLLDVGTSPQEILDFLDAKPISQLGGCPMEGVVLKNLSQQMMVGPMMFECVVVKFVHEAFKEVHQKNWKQENTGKGRWQIFQEQFATEQRWLKSIQHMAEDGRLLGEPKDIGTLMIEIKKDIGQECKDEIVKFLWKEFGQELLRNSVRGMPEWYKERLALGEINQYLGGTPNEQE